MLASICEHFCVCVCVCVCVFSCVWRLEIGLVWFVSISEVANTSKRLSTQSARGRLRKGWKHEIPSSFWTPQGRYTHIDTRACAHTRGEREGGACELQIKTLSREYISTFMSFLKWGRHKGYGILQRDSFSAWQKRRRGPKECAEKDRRSKLREDSDDRRRRGARGCDVTWVQVWLPTYTS